jgi:hypothetical protein
VRRLPGRCYFCGDPCASFWFCAEHLWAQGLVVDPGQGLDYLSPEHRWWIERVSKEQIVEIGGYLERPMFQNGGRS